MNIQGATLLVTGANRGLGKALVAAALAAGAGKIYAAARDDLTIEQGDARVVPIALDLTSDASVAALAQRCPDVQIIINNAAYLSNQSALRAEALDLARLEMETNYWGTLRLVRALAPVLAVQPESVLLNILSIGALAGIPFCSGYCASKAALWSMTQSLRYELAAQGTAVLAAFPGPIATGMARPHQQQGRHPADEVATAIIAGIASGSARIFPDPVSVRLAQTYATDPWALTEMFAGSVD